jgi:hypothetical protein
MLSKPLERQRRRGRSDRKREHRRQRDRRRCDECGSDGASAAVANASPAVAMPMLAPTPTTDGWSEAVVPARPGNDCGSVSVTHEATSVNGGDGCDLVAGALAQQSPRSRRSNTRPLIDHPSDIT